MKKDIDFHIRVSREDLQRIDAKAKEVKMSRSKFLIQAALQQNIIIVGTDELRRLTSELRRIGININQIAVLCNMGKITCVQLIDTNKELNQVWKSIESLRKDIKKINEKRN